MNRWRDWWLQAERDLAHARHALEDGDYEWSAFAAQQGAEKALKAVILASGGEPSGHLTTQLAESVPDPERVPAAVLDAARRLDNHYMPGHYANGFAGDFPGQLYTHGEAAHAIADASLLFEFCRGRLPR